MRTLEDWEAFGVRFEMRDGGDFTVHRPVGLAATELRASADALRSAYLAREWRRYLAERPLPTDDPRADLADHAKWAAVLPLAHGHNSELFEVLHGLRCLGAQIIGGRLGCGEMTPAEYGGYRALLMPHGAMVAEVLRGR